MELTTVTLSMSIGAVIAFMIMGVLMLLFLVFYIIANEWPDTKKRLEKEDK